MLAPGGQQPSSYAPGHAGALGSPQFAALADALAGLADVSDAVAQAVQHHDRPALDAANARAEELLAAIAGLNPLLTEQDRLLIDGDMIAGLAERLAGGARRNAYLIEQAWAVDAALMRLIMGVGKEGAYGEPATPAYVDRQA